MKEFLKENFVLALGVSLPVILIVVFMFAQSLTKLVDPPQYKAVFALQNHYHGQKPFKFKVDEQTGKLTITYTEPETPENQSRYHYNTRLYIYDPAQDNLQETELEAGGAGRKRKHHYQRCGNGKSCHQSGRRIAGRLYLYASQPARRQPFYRTVRLPQS